MLRRRFRSTPTEGRNLPSVPSVPSVVFVVYLGHGMPDRDHQPQGNYQTWVLNKITQVGVVEVRALAIKSCTCLYRSAFGWRTRLYFLLISRCPSRLWSGLNIQYARRPRFDCLMTDRPSTLHTVYVGAEDGLDPPSKSDLPLDWWLGRKAKPPLTCPKRPVSYDLWQNFFDLEKRQLTV